MRVRWIRPQITKTLSKRSLSPSSPALLKASLRSAPFHSHLLCFSLSVSTCFCNITILSKMRSRRGWKKRQNWQILERLLDTVYPSLLFIMQTKWLHADSSTVLFLWKDNWQATVKSVKRHLKKKKEKSLKQNYADESLLLIFMIRLGSFTASPWCPCTCTDALRPKRQCWKTVCLLYSAAVGQESCVETPLSMLPWCFQRSISRVCLSVDGNRRGQALPELELLASFMCPFALVSVCQ